MKSKLLLLLFFTLSLTGCFSSVSPEEHIKEIIGIDVSSCKIENIKNTHGGFLGDGDTTIKLNCQENKEVILKQFTNWKTLPLTENLQLEMYGGEKDGVDYLYGHAKENGIPAITNGYYYFIDRQTNKTSDEELFNAYSYNFTLALYDIDTNLMYYYELDT